MRIVHDIDFDESLLRDYYGEPYFRLIHTLHNITDFALPNSFPFCSASIDEFVEHINSCYGNLCASAEELQRYTMHPVYCQDLWIAIKDDRSGMSAASGIGELDRKVGEGVLEWIQVSNNHRGKGLGSCMVQELLRRMKSRADFVTVSGQCNNPANPEALYRKCGFVGNDIWHIMRKK